MSFYLAAFYLETYKAFAESPRDVVGFRVSYRSKAKVIRPGDRLVAYCYWRKFCRWLGVLEVSDNYYMDDSPWLGEKGCPVRLKVRPLVWLSPEKSVPIHENNVWGSLLFTKEMDTNSTWLGNLTGLPDEDGRFLEGLLSAQQAGGDIYPVDEEKHLKRKLRVLKEGANAEATRKSQATGLSPVTEKAITVAVPVVPPPADEKSGEVRESARIQATLAMCGEKMGFKIWLPKNDRPLILQKWTPLHGSLLEVLPLNYDASTLRTIENIDVLWIRGSAIARAFEIEHTTAVYSGLLRMADLLAMQPNMRIAAPCCGAGGPAPESISGNSAPSVFTARRRSLVGELFVYFLRQYCGTVPKPTLRTSHGLGLRRIRTVRELDENVTGRLGERPRNARSLRKRNQTLQRTGHAIHGSSCFSALSRVSRLLSFVVRRGGCGVFATWRRVSTCRTLWSVWVS